MPRKMPRSAPPTTFGPHEPSVAVCAPRLPCRKALRVRVSTPGRVSSGESRLNKVRRQRIPPWRRGRHNTSAASCG